MTLNKDLSSLVEYIRDQMVDLASHLSPAQLQAAGKADHWSAKDNIFHALVWADRRLVILETLERGESWTDIDYGDFEEENRRVWEDHQDRSWEEAQNMTRSSYAALLDYLDRISEDSLSEIKEGEEQPVWRSIANSYVLHPMIHIWDLLKEAGKEDLLADTFGDDFDNHLRKVDDSDTWQGTILYNRACLYALSGNAREALKSLQTALDLSPQLVEWSKQDSDLDSLRSLPEYQALFSND